MHKRLQRVLTALAITGLAVPGTLATTTGTAAADVPGVIATVQACVNAASNPTSSLPACTALAAQLTTIFGATPSGVSPIVDQIETTIQTSAFQTLGGVLADADACVNGTDPTCASVAQTLANVEQALVLLAQREENALLTFAQDCVAQTNATCHSVFDDIQGLITLGEQEAAFVAVTASQCLSAASGRSVQVPTGQIIVGGVPEPSCDTLLGQLPALLGDIGVVVSDLQACIAGTNATPCQTAEQAVAGVLSDITQNLAKLLQATEECASGTNPTCGAAIDTINQTAAAVQQAVEQCATDTDPTSVCAVTVAQVTNALDYIEGTTLSCSGIEAEADCAPLEAATIPALQAIGLVDLQVGPVEVVGDPTTGDVGYALTKVSGSGGAHSMVVAPTLPVPAIGVPDAPGLDINTFDTSADALAAGDLNAAGTATNTSGGCSSSNDQLGGPPDKIYPPQPAIISDKNERIQFNIIAYQKNHARSVVDPSTGAKALSWQINDCVYGGGRSYNHNNLWMAAASVVEYVDPDSTYQIGYNWKSGDSVSHPSMNLSFKLNVGVAEVDGDIGSHANGTNNGAVFNPPPYFTPTSDPICVESCTNEVTGWWKQTHSFYDVKTHWGSNSFQGAAFGGLFEFSEATQPGDTWDASAYDAIFCTQTRGCK